MASDSAFLCHNSADKPEVEELARRLLAVGIKPWLDKWNLTPGEDYQPAIEEALDQCTAIVIFLGPTGRSPYQREEVQLAINDRGMRGTRVIPVLLPGASRTAIRGFLRNRNEVRFETIDDDEAFRRLVAGIRGVPPGPPASGMPDPAHTVGFDGGCPYPGLTAFDMKDWQVFFGRERIIRRAVDKLNELLTHPGASRFLGVVGASGSGKSSLARAGILHKLQEGHPGSEIEVLVPGRQTPDSAADHLHSLSGSSAKEKAPLVLLVDQFEEIFTIWDRPDIRAAFISDLCAASRSNARQIIVIVTLRADFYENCAQFTDLAQCLAEQQVLVGPMDSSDLREAITGPADMAECTVEPELVQSLIRDCEAQPSPLPLLQIVLAKLWKKKGSGTVLTQASYEPMRFEGAIDDHAEEFFQDLPEDQKDPCLALFLQLIEFAGEDRYVRRRVTLESVLPPETDPAAVKRVESLIGKLSGPRGRLISICHVGKITQIEIAHEAIIRGWKRLAAWLAKNSEFLSWKKRLDVSVTDWRNSKESDCFLTGVLLQHAVTWLDQKEAGHTAEEERFIRASVRRHRSRIAGSAAAAAIVLALVAGLAIWSQHRMKTQRLVEDARHYISARQPIGMVLAYEAEKQNPGVSQEELLQNAIQTYSNPLLAFPDGEPTGFNHLLLSADGRKVAAATNSAGVLLWEPASTGNASSALLWSADRIQQPTVFQLAGRAQRVSFDANNDLVAAGSDTGAVKIWRMANGKEAWTPPAQDSGIAALALSSDGQYIALATQSNHISWWKNDGAAPEFSATASDTAGGLAVRPDGAVLAAALHDGSVAFWLLASGKQAAPAIRSPFATLNYIAYSADGRIIATTAEMGDAGVWDAKSGASKGKFQQPGQPVLNGAITRDGGRLATLNNDGSITVWDVRSRAPYLHLEKPPEDPAALAFSGDGRHLAVSVKGHQEIRMYELEAAALRQRAWEVIVDLRDKLADCPKYLGSACDEYLRGDKPR